MSETRSSTWLGVLLIVVILAVSVAAALWILFSAPKPERIKPVIKARLVDVVDIQPSSQRPEWTAGGEVEAVEITELGARVSGYVKTLNAKAVPGAILKQGDALLWLDDASFRLAVTQQQAAVTQAKADLAVQQGEAAVAQDEYALVANDLSASDRALVLKQPQLNKAKAVLQGQKAALRSAQMDLSWTAVRMPFDGQVQSRSVSRGSQVSTASTLFEVVNTGHFWVRVKVPSTFLSWLDKDAEVVISHPGWKGEVRHGHIVSTLPGVSEADRQAQILVEVSDPLDLGGKGVPKLLLNDFVTVTLAGRSLDSTVVVPMRQLEDDDSIWVVNNRALTRRQLTVLYRGRQNAWVSDGFQAGDQLLTNRIDGAVEGLPVRFVGTLALPASDSLVTDSLSGGGEQ